MSTDEPKILLGCVLAPLAAPLMVLLIILVVGEDFRGSSYQFGSSDVVEIFGVAGIFLVLGAPIAYAIAVVIGLPLFFIAKRLGFINIWSVSLGAAITAILPILALSARNGFALHTDPEKSSLLFYLVFSLCGSVVGLLFWFISGLYKQSAHNQSLKRGPRKQRAAT